MMIEIFSFNTRTNNINSIILEKLLLKIFPFAENYFNNFEKKIFLSNVLNINSKIIFLIFLLFVSSTLVINDKSIIKYDEIKKNYMIGNNLMNTKLIELTKDDKLNRNNFITDFQLIFYVPALKNILIGITFFIKIKNLYNFDYYLIYGNHLKLGKLFKRKFIIRSSNYS